MTLRYLPIGYCFHFSTHTARGGKRKIARNGLRTNVRLSYPNSADFVPKRDARTSQSYSAPLEMFAMTYQEDTANELPNGSARPSRLKLVLILMFMTNLKSATLF